MIECRERTEMMGIPDIMTNLVSIGEIKQAIANFSKQVLTEEIKASAKVGDRWSEYTLNNSYLKYMSLPKSRIWMRLRAKSIKGVKVNNKMGCFNDPAWKVCGWWWWGGCGVADTNYLYPARWGWINIETAGGNGSE